MLRPRLPRSSIANPNCPTEYIWGHVLQDIDPSNTFQIIPQNPNGLKLNTGMDDFIIGARTLYSLSASVVGLV
jgi:hypothetical protein